MQPTVSAPDFAPALAAAGYATLPGLYSPAEVAALLACVESAPAASPNFRRSADVFAIRDLLGEVPGLWPLLLHASGRSSSAHPRRVLHLEFSAAALPAGLSWREGFALE